MDLFLMAKRKNISGTSRTYVKKAIWITQFLRFGAILQISGTPIDLFALLGLHLLDVELELGALEDVAVGASALAGPGVDLGQELALHELGLELLLDGGGSLALVELGLGLLAGGLLAGEVGLLLLGGLPVLLAAAGDGVVVLVVLPEGSGVDGADGALDQGLGPDHLVGGGVVDDVDDPGDLGDAFAGPAEVAVVEPEGAELFVAAHGADHVDADVGDQLGVGLLSAELELALFVHLGLFATGFSGLVPGVTSDTHGEVFLGFFFAIKNL